MRSCKFVLIWLSIYSGLHGWWADCIRTTPIIIIACPPSHFTHTHTPHTHTSQQESDSEFVNSYDRDEMVRWLCLLTHDLHYRLEVFFRATNLLDTFLSLVKVSFWMWLLIWFQCGFSLWWFWGCPVSSWWVHVSAWWVHWLVSLMCSPGVILS